MFGNKKTLSDRIKEVLTEYIDKKFEDYRSQLANDLSRGLAALAGLVAIWTLAIVCLMFVSIALALLLGWAFTFWMNSFSYVLSFLIIAVFLLSTAFIILFNKKRFIEDPVFNIMSETLNKAETRGFKNKEKKKKEKTSTEINVISIPEKTIEERPKEKKEDIDLNQQQKENNDPSKNP